MFCKHCGNKLEENTAFCPNCGQCVAAPATPVPPVTPAPPAEAVPAEAPKKKEKPVKVKGAVNWKVFIIMMVIGALVLGIGGFVIVNLLNGDGPFGDLLGGTTSSSRDDDDEDDDDKDRDEDEDEDRDADEDRDEDKDKDDPYEGTPETMATEPSTQAPDAAVSDSYIFYSMGSFNFYVMDYLDLEEMYDDSEYVYLENDTIGVTAVKWYKDDYEDIGIYNSMDMLDYMATSAQDAGLHTYFDERYGQTYLVAYGENQKTIICFYETGSYYYAVQVMLTEDAMDDYMYEAVEIVTGGYFD